METVLLKRNFCCLLVAVVGLLGQSKYNSTIASTSTSPTGTSAIISSPQTKQDNQSSSTNHTNASNTYATNVQSTTTPKIECYQYSCDNKTGQLICKNANGNNITKASESDHCASTFGCYNRTTESQKYEIGCLNVTCEETTNLTCCSEDYCNKILEEIHGNQSGKSEAQMQGLNQLLICFLCAFLFLY